MRCDVDDQFLDFDLDGPGATAAYTFQPFALDVSRNLAGLLIASSGRHSDAPEEALSATGDRGALLRFAMATASTPRKKAVRMIAPRFPGSSYSAVRKSSSMRKCTGMTQIEGSPTIPSRSSMNGNLGITALYSI